MGKIDVKSKTDVVQLFTKIQRTTTATILGTEVADYLGAAFVVDVGAHTTDGLTITFQHRDGAAAYADIPAAELDFSGQIVSVNGFEITDDEEDEVIKVGYLGNKEDIGAVITDTASGDAVVGVSVIKGFNKDIT